jgi:hypothetical protein
MPRSAARSAIAAISVRSPSFTDAFRVTSSACVRDSRRAPTAQATRSSNETLRVSFGETDFACWVLA